MRIVLIIVALLVPLQASDKFYEIPKILWTFWDSGFDSAKLFTKMCINNMAHYSRISGWEFRFLSNENYTRFLSKESLARLDNMYLNSEHKISKQNWADLMRLFLVFENGGMWIDTNSFFLGNFSWLDNIKQEKWVINRITPEPEMITFSLSTVMGGNTTTVYDDRLEQEVYLFPGVEIWSFISKPKSKFLTDVLNRLQYSLKTARKELDEETQRENILFGRQKDPYYITSNYVFQTVMQKKQHEIEQGLLANVSYAVEYYSMWNIPSENTIYGIFSVHNWFTFSIIGSLYKEDLRTFMHNYNIPPYFIKFNGGNYPHANNALVYHEFVNCLGVDVKINEGSVFDEFMLKINKNLTEISHILQLYERGYMNDHECHRIDSRVSDFFFSLKGKVALAALVIVGLHALLFVEVKQRVLKTHDH